MTTLREKIITRAESFPGLKAGIARLDDVLNSPSYHAASGHMSTNGLGAAWPAEAQSVIVLGLHLLASGYTAVSKTRDATWYKVIEKIALVTGKAKDVASSTVKKGRK